jgi:hypothetical protein
MLIANGARINYDCQVENAPCNVRPKNDLLMRCSLRGLTHLAGFVYSIKLSSVKALLVMNVASSIFSSCLLRQRHDQTCIGGLSIWIICEFK